MIFKNMNNKKSKRLLSKKHKRNKKIRNTRKNYKREGGGKGDLLKEAAKQFLKAATTVKVPVIKNEIYKAIAATNANNFVAKIQTAESKIAKEVGKEIIQEKIKEFFKENNNQNEDVERELKKIAEKEEKIKFSEIASEEWFKPSNALLSKINTKRADANWLLILKDKEVEEVDWIFNEEKKEEIITYFRFLSKDTREEYDIPINADSITYIGFEKIQKKIANNEKLLKKESTFTYNLLKNIDLSPKEIFEAYCKKWTVKICKDGDTPMIFLGRTLFHYVFPSNNVSNNITPPVTSSVIRNNPSTVSIFNSSLNRLPYTPLLGFGISINLFATIRTIYGALFGFDEKWLHYILGILDPSVINIFNDIKESDKNGLDFITSLVSAMSGKTEDDMEEYYEEHPNIRELKDKLNNFFKKNASSFSVEYTTTHFIGLSETIKETIKTEVAKQILIIARGLNEQFGKELLHFIINAEHLKTMEFEESLKVEADIAKLYEEAMNVINITPEV